MYKNIVNPLTEEKDKLETEIKQLKETIEKLGGNNNNIKTSEDKKINSDKEINALKQKISEQNNISEELRKIVDNKYI